MFTLLLNWKEIEVFRSYKCLFSVVVKFSSTKCAGVLLLFCLTENLATQRLGIPELGWFDRLPWKFLFDV